MVRLNGVLQTLNMPPTERLTIRLPPKTAVPSSSLGQMGPHSSQLPTTDSKSSGPSEFGVQPPFSNDEVERDSDESMDEEGELISKLDQWLESDLDSGMGDEDVDDPEWDYEDGETRVKDTTYVFCPAPHRKPILHLFTKHFCQHPVFPECNEGSCSVTEIRKRAVLEMYQFCWQRGLQEVWDTFGPHGMHRAGGNSGHTPHLHICLGGEQRWESKTSGNS